jgi:hypothetical protein
MAAAAVPRRVTDEWEEERKSFKDKQKTLSCSEQKARKVSLGSKGNRSRN